MRALKSCIRVALAGGTLVSAVAAGPVAAFAQTQGDGQAVAGNSDVTPLSKEAAGLPKVSPSQLLKLAESQVGIHENSYGGGTKFQAWYMSSPRAQETVARDGGNVSAYANAAWCDMFVSWVGNKLGIRPVLGSDAYTVAHARWFAQNNRWGSAPKPGAVVFFALNGGKSIDSIDHVGFVIKDNGNGTIQTVEGNTLSGEVAIRTRPTWQVAGYGYPYYTASDPA
ncbi:hypothetical protein Pth03_03140 [Planotetraspora thailandica]|uniref:Peptidase C51 domain-containing protein n=1 Tax=Planotetraspora thailandica TaxID=487172 RepID=A0A8J3UWC7_9ACTN|nr:CHAP domain-containing protein [Planotetraspora thailandica]GII51925.1 hypothetical protein Pth03_03140 [Planotetraspora thailandica]